MACSPARGARADRLAADRRSPRDRERVSEVSHPTSPPRPPTAGEVGTCDPFLNAEVRTINPEVLSVGQQALGVLVAEHTTLREPPPAGDAHATEIRGRDFLLVPTRDPVDATDAEERAIRETLKTVFGGEYRQRERRRRKRERTERSRRESGPNPWL